MGRSIARAMVGNRIALVLFLHFCLLGIYARHLRPYHATPNFLSPGPLIPKREKAVLSGRCFFSFGRFGRHYDACSMFQGTETQKAPEGACRALHFAVSVGGIPGQGCIPLDTPKPRWFVAGLRLGQRPEAPVLPICDSRQACAAPGFHQSW